MSQAVSFNQFSFSNYPEAYLGVGAIVGIAIIALSFKVFNDPAVFSAIFLGGSSLYSICMGALLLNGDYQEIKKPEVEESKGISAITPQNIKALLYRPYSTDYLKCTPNTFSAIETKKNAYAILLTDKAALPRCIEFRVENNVFIYKEKACQTLKDLFFYANIKGYYSLERGTGKKEHYSFED